MVPVRTHSPHHTRQKEVNKEPYVHPSREVIGLEGERDGSQKIIHPPESGEELIRSERTKEGESQTPHSLCVNTDNLNQQKKSKIGEARVVTNIGLVIHRKRYTGCVMSLSQ